MSRETTYILCPMPREIIRKILKGTRENLVRKSFRDLALVQGKVSKVKCGGHMV